MVFANGMQLHRYGTLLKGSIAIFSLTLSKESKE